MIEICQAVVTSCLAYFIHQPVSCCYSALAVWELGLIHIRGYAKSFLTSIPVLMHPHSEVEVDFLQRQLVLLSNGEGLVAWGTLNKAGTCSQTCPHEHLPPSPTRHRTPTLLERLHSAISPLIWFAELIRCIYRESYISILCSVSFPSFKKRVNWAAGEEPGSEWQHREGH